MKRKFFQIYFFLCVCFWIASAKRDSCTDLARGDETLMLFSTLGGGLTAVDPVTSEIRWTILDEPAVKCESQHNLGLPHYLPDPRDGSIYQLGNMGDVKKLPYKIPELVANAPCRSSDGILYSGRKSDTWFMIDPKSGQREQIMGFNHMSDQTNDKIGWATSRSIYLGRTQYTVMMYDSLSKNKSTKPWNITFYDYASHTMAPEISSEYEYIHLAASSSGLIATLDRKEAKLKWQKDLISPVVAVFVLGSEGLLSVPFTTLSDAALQSLLEKSMQGKVNELKLFQSLYIGENVNGLYALPSFADTETAIISFKSSIKLLEGSSISLNKPNKRVVNLNYIHQSNNNAIVLGHYEIPVSSDFSWERNPSNIKSIDDKKHTTILKMGSIKEDKRINIVNGLAQNIVEPTDQRNNFFVANQTNNASDNIPLPNQQHFRKFINNSKSWFLDHPSGVVHQILAILVITMLIMAWYTCITFRELKSQSQNGLKIMTSTSINYSDSQDSIDSANGFIRIGKITFDPFDVLGKGCEGTFVFRGEFDERPVAVKRLLPECFSLADREVALLRESDAHENVIRYFCTEQDRQFRYIAVELCSATLQDYTEGNLALNLKQQINVWDILTQSISGLTHLHSLNIVHRDIKPQNILISLPDSNGHVKIMISDFGLCKKLKYGELSYRGQSGITGTDGWIAHEIIENGRRTAAVDIFSMGCVFYYVLTNGSHPFGGVLERQGNILSGLKKLSKLLENKVESKSKMILSEQLISDMIHRNPERRPTAIAIANHPIFWHQNKILAFLQDVSDRVEKIQLDIEPLLTLEKNWQLVVNGDWSTYLDDVIKTDLRKYRGYNGASVRDLLRAFRNKKHHYHELTTEAQLVLGSIPNDFTNYWILKFPYLLSHAYHALSTCSTENVFKTYYKTDYHFTKPDYFLLNESNPVQLNIQSKSIQKSDESPSKVKSSALRTYNRKGYYNFQKISSKDADEATINNKTKTNVLANFHFKNRSNKSKKNLEPRNNVSWILEGKSDNINNK